MGFLNRFFQDVFEANQTVQSTEPFASDQSATSFIDAAPDHVAAHLEVDQYESFKLTDAVRPAMDLQVKPVEGYRHDVYSDDSSNAQVPVIMAAVSKEKLFPLFMQLIQRLGPVVDVVLETSHDQDETGKHTDLYREHIDLPVLTSILWDYEELLTNDGCTGIAVLNPRTPQEIQFDEHKLLIAYGSPLESLEHTMELAGVRSRPNMQFITEAEHVHSSSEEFQRRFRELKTDLGLDGSQSQEEDKYDDGYGDPMEEGFC